MSALYRKIIPILSLILALTLVGCSSLSGSEPTEDPNEISYTQAAETIVAALTQNAPQASPTSSEGISSPATATQETLPPSSTPLPTETLPPTSTPVPTDTPFPTETSPPTFTYTPTLPPQPSFFPLFEDDFEQRYGWPIERMESAEFLFTAGGYAIKSRVKNDLVFAVRSDAFADVRIDVDAKVASGPLDSYYGVVCRFMNGGNYYILAVGSDGWYGIGKKVLSQLHFIQEGNDVENIIYTAGLANRIRADCLKDSLSLYVNGEKMLEVIDAEFTAGSIGLVVGNRTDEEVQILFDNFALFEPE